MHHASPLTWFAVASSVAASAQTATLTVSHNDPDGIVLPGETVTITSTVAWSGGLFTFWELRGGVTATDDLGSASNTRFGYQSYSSTPDTIVDPGETRGGSVDDAHFFSALFYGFWQVFPQPWSTSGGLNVLQFEWTAPAVPGTVEFQWDPDPTLPDIWLVPALPPGVAAQSTYHGTSLTVIPGPASALPILAALFVPHRRRR